MLGTGFWGPLSCFIYRFCVYLKKMKNFLKFKFIIHLRGSEFGLIMTRIFRPKKYTEIKKKWAVIKEFQQKYQIKVFVETGTYLGETIRGIKNYFNEIYSIELDPVLFTNATNNFAFSPKVKLFQGDSAIVLSQVLQLINKRTLFWLDAHASGGITAQGEKVTPVTEEILAIIKHPIKNHIILIDDAESFIGVNDYPAIDNIKNIIKEISLGYKLEIEDDIIRIYL